MFGRHFFGGRMYGPRYFGDGGDLPPAAIAASGGWVFPRDESETERQARIHSERVKRGILPPDEPKPAALEAAGEAIEGAPATLVSPETLAFAGGVVDAALALDLAQLHTGAYLDMEIARHFRILEDEDDAAVLMLAIAVLH